ncbi:MAG: maleylpyruvate isomerase family mycothiol-dependent enzyme [Anaerolineae bacterium]|nr:maleylpyruvate isomerase family mycothiol-dependent enzyme [Anaerolineae bacterium]
MNPQMAVPSTLIGQHLPQHAAAVPRLSRQEVVPLARVELERFLALAATLTTDDLRQPTDCALWSVKDIIAHQASHVLALTRLGEFMDQFNPLNFRDYSARRLNSLDAANQRQVDRRADWSLIQLIAEMRDNREQSLAGRQRFPLPARWIRLGAPGFDGKFSLGELIDSIFTRDMWMHRVDICMATGRDMTLTAEHDGRIVALVMRDLDRRLSVKLDGHSTLYRLTGRAGGEWLVGGDAPAGAALTFDALQFNRLASGRITSQQALEQGLVKVEGDADLARRALDNTMVLY